MTFLVNYFRVTKTKELIGRKYHRLSLKKDIKTYFKSCNIRLASKIVKFKLYKDLQLMPIPIYYLKNLWIDFVTSFLVSTNRKGKIYNLILVIDNWLIKRVYYKPMKVMINAFKLAKVIIYVIVWHHNFSNFIVSNQKLLFTLKFLSLHCYFFGIKQRLLFVFYLQVNNYIKCQNSVIEPYC